MSLWQDPFLPAGFSRRETQLYCEKVSLQALAVNYGTPLYVYSLDHIRARLSRLEEALGERGRVCYAVKANDNLGLLSWFSGRGIGFDVVSAGEMQRVVRAGGDASTVVFSGVGKQVNELKAATSQGIASINIESVAEADMLVRVSQELKTSIPVAVRVNPDIDPGTHPKIATGMASAKFGVPLDQARELYRRLADEPGINVQGVAFHIGSQLLDTTPVIAALDRTLVFVEELARLGINIEHIDIGGGLGIRYDAADEPVDAGELIGTVLDRLPEQYELWLEPGRYLVGNAGMLLTEVVLQKNTENRYWTVVDAAMNDLMRPALYDAWHEVVPVDAATGSLKGDLVGPVCESSDVFAHDRLLPSTPAGGLLAILGAGAYGSVMANSYNTRPRPAEVLVDGDQVALLRERETVDELLARDAVELEWGAP